jgi:hypothetical protein
MEPEDVKALVNAELNKFMQGFESRLAISMQKALDIVTAQQEERIRSLEEDVARLQRKK